MTDRVVLRVVNAQGVSERRPQDEITAGILEPSVYGEVNVWLLCEIAWADLEGIARKHGLHALHYGERGSAEAGVGILSREPIGQPLMRVGSRAVPGVRMRPFCSGRTYGLSVTAAHAPPPRTPVARALYLRQIRHIGGVVAGDFNQRPDLMRAHFKRQYRAIGVLGVLVPPRWKSSPAKPVDIGSDHPAVDVVLRRRG